MTEEQEMKALSILFRDFGPARGVQLLGYGLWWGFLGHHSPEDMARASERTGGPARPSTYRALRDMRKLRLALAAEGIPVGNDQELVALLTALGQRLPGAPKRGLVPV